MTTALVTATVRHSDIIQLPGPDALIDLWHADLALKVAGHEMSDATARVYRIGLRKLREYLHSVGEAQITTDAMRRWKAALLTDGYKPGSVNLWLAGAKTFTAWARKAGYTPVDPGEDVDGAKRRGANKRHSRQAFDDTEMRRLLDYAKGLPARDRCYLMLRAYCGVRDIELHRADLGDIGTEGGQRVLYKTMKGHREADDVAVIAHPDAVNALLDWLQERGGADGPLFTSGSRRNMGGRWSQSAARRMILEARKATGIYSLNKTSHSIRHSAATSALRRGESIRNVQAMLGHASVDTTMIYAHEVERVENAAEKSIDYGA
jgi:integrase/recombinase XerC/integrase/recombinase XerD